MSFVWNWQFETAGKARDYLGRSLKKWDRAGKGMGVVFGDGRKHFLLSAPVSSGFQAGFGEMKTRSDPLR